MGYFGAITILPPGQQPLLFRYALDCSCFFTEGYGMMFPLTWAPILVIATILRELIARKMANRIRSA
jgi:hypothetical protein